jgi:hypothetical protein
MDIVDEISQQQTSNQSVAKAVVGRPLFLRDVPQEPVIIEVIRPREGQLNFTEMFASYTAGELVEVILQEAILREKALDLWVAIVSDEGVLVFITEQGFSDTPAAFKMQVPVEEASHSVLNFTVPQGLTGRYTVLATFNQPLKILETELKRSEDF